MSTLEKPATAANVKRIVVGIDGPVLLISKPQTRSVPEPATTAAQTAARSTTG